MMLLICRARHPVDVLTEEFVNFGGWLSDGDLALDSEAQCLVDWASTSKDWSSVGVGACLLVRIRSLVVMRGSAARCAS